MALDNNYCRKCKIFKSINGNNFYEATNPFLDSNGWMSICRDCCNNIYDEYFKRKRCLLVNCSWSELSNENAFSLPNIQRPELIA